jgi:hypothetical protein
MIAALGVAVALGAVKGIAPEEGQMVLSNEQIRIIAERKEEGYGIVSFPCAHWEAMATHRSLATFGANHLRWETRRCGLATEFAFRHQKPKRVEAFRHFARPRRWRVAGKIDRFPRPQ